MIGNNYIIFSNSYLLYFLQLILIQFMQILLHRNQFYCPLKCYIFPKYERGTVNNILTVPPHTCKCLLQQKFFSSFFRHQKSAYALLFFWGIHLYCILQYSSLFLSHLIMHLHILYITCHI